MGHERAADGFEHAARDATIRVLIAAAGALFLFLIVAYAHPLAATAATLAVATTHDTVATGDGLSLREAIACINAGSNAPAADCPATPSPGYGTNDTIQFSTLNTITLTGGTLTLARDVAITSFAGNVIDGGCTLDSGGLCTTGGVRVFTVNSGVSVTMTGLTIQRGNAGAGSGGAIANSGTLALVGCAIVSNAGSASGGTGGAIFNGGGATLFVTNSTFARNSANIGGALYSVGSVTVRNSTFSANSAANTGGGLSRGVGTFSLVNTIVAGNTGGAHPDVDGTFGSAGNNLIGETDGSTGFTAPGDQTGTVASPLDPLLGTLGVYNGMNTQTFPLLPGSPAIDKGNDSVCNTAPVSQLDQRRVFRSVGTHCDIGAFESQGFSEAIVSGSNIATTPNAVRRRARARRGERAQRAGRGRAYRLHRQRGRRRHRSAQ
jgi:hypothetical protein